MSKSKGEFLTVSLLEEKGYDPLVYRFFCLNSHYRKSLVFSWEGLDNAKLAYDKLASKIAAIKDEGELDRETFDALKSRFCEALDNDINTSMAVTCLYDVLKAKTNGKTKLALIADFDRVLSVGLIEAAEKIKSSAEQQTETKAEAAVPAEDAWIVEAIEARAAAKKAKNYAEADRIRAELLEKGIVLTDTAGGTTYTKN